MRRAIVFGLLVVMLFAFGGLLAVRPRSAHDAPAPPGDSAPGATAQTASTGQAGASASAGAAAVVLADAAAPGDGGPTASATSSAKEPNARPEPLLDRPLRVVSIGWELAAPGLLVNGGMTPSPTSEFSAAGLTVHLAAVDGMASVEAAMARGGADKDGADVALVALPSFVASYEKLRALSPEVFFVVGWSRGREALVSSHDALPSPPVKGELKMAAVAGEPAAFLGLFVLDAAGIAPADVRLVAPGSKVEDAPLAAIDRGVEGGPDAARKNLLLTTADTPRLIPFVAVSPRGMLEKSGPALSAWARVWLEGMKRLAADAPSGARQVAAVRGAPDPLALLKRMGEMAPATLGDNARVAGLSGRGALTLEVLFQRSWQLWRGVGLLATPSPDAAPVSNAVVATIARAQPSLVEPPAVRPSEGQDGKKFDGASDKGKALFVHRLPEGKLDEDALVASAGLLATVFERSPVRIAVHQGGAVDGARTKRMIERIQDRFDIPPGRLVPAKSALGKGAAAIEVLAAP